MSADSIAALVKKRGSVKAKLTIFGKYLSALNNVPSLSEVQVTELSFRLAKVESLYLEFDVFQNEIELLSEKVDEAYQERDDFEKQYYELVAVARTLLAAKHLPSTANLLDPSLPLPTLVKIFDQNGASHSARMLLDNRSTSNFITQSLSDKLGLVRRSTGSTVTAEG